MRYIEEWIVYNMRKVVITTTLIIMAAAYFTIGLDLEHELLESKNGTMESGETLKDNFNLIGRVGEGIGEGLDGGLDGGEGEGEDDDRE